jgi:signal transduction histidine kinase
VRSLLAPALATVLVAVAVATLAGVYPFAAVGLEPLAYTGFGVVLGLLLLCSGWFGRHEAAGTAVSVALLGWELWSAQTQASASVVLVAFASASGVIVVLGAGRLIGPWRPVVAALAIGALAVHLVSFQPFDRPACGAVCLQTWAPVADWWGARGALGVAVLLEWILVVVMVAPVRGARVAALAPVLLAAAADTVPWWTWYDPDPASVDDWFRTLAVVLVGVGSTWLVARRAQRRSALRRLVHQLSREETFPGVAFAVPGSNRWVDYTGVPVEPAGGIDLRGPDGSVAVRVPGSWRELDELSIADRLLLDTARLSVVARTRQHDVQASRRRIAAVSDAERRRIERDLHDGVQQQLLGAGMLLAAANDPSLTAAEADIRQASAALREIVHGSLLGVLSSEGLVAAVEDLTEGTSCELVAEPLDEVDPSVERAAYDLVSEAVATARGPMTIRLERGHGQLVVVCEPSPAVPWLPVSDRVAATGGVVTESAAGLRAEWA